MQVFFGIPTFFGKHTLAAPYLNNRSKQLDKFAFLVIISNENLRAV